MYSRLSNLAVELLTSINLLNGYTVIELIQDDNSTLSNGLLLNSKKHIQTYSA